MPALIYRGPQFVACCVMAMPDAVTFVKTDARTGDPSGAVVERPPLWDEGKVICRNCGQPNAKPMDFGDFKCKRWWCKKHGSDWIIYTKDDWDMVRCSHSNLIPECRFYAPLIPIL